MTKKTWSSCRVIHAILDGFHSFFDVHAEMKTACEPCGTGFSTRIWPTKAITLPGSAQKLMLRVQKAILTV